MKQKDIRVCGSVRSNRKGMPAIPKADMDALTQGKWIDVQNGDMNLLVWRDRKDVWLLYNHISPLLTSSFKRRDERGAKVDLVCPQAIHDYFYQARAVDIDNQLHYSYPIGRKSKKCWPRLAWWLIDMCIVNAYILWSMGKRDCTQLQFREELMFSLVKLFGSDREAVQVSRGANVSVALAKDHYLKHADTRADCVYCSHQPENRVTSSYQCAKCLAHLCIGRCFANYHNK